MSALQARLKPQFSAKYPGLNAVTWYDVDPLWPGLTERNTNLLGQRLTRLKTPREHTTVLAEHLEFRPRPSRATESVPTAD
ncbi:MAG TPA: hypothetical protein VFS28_00535 [Gemmatimonadales bacterium]|jgi:hypothetical protein|nr:hypothetical protein [Gemmatimonadales bacterium]